MARKILFQIFKINLIEFQELTLKEKDGLGDIEKKIT